MTTKVTCTFRREGENLFADFSDGKSYQLEVTPDGRIKPYYDFASQEEATAHLEAVMTALPALNAVINN